MPKIQCSNIEIDYFEQRTPGQPVVLGVQGLAEGWRFWPQSFYAALQDAGYGFVALDNRDIGGSTIMHAAGAADIPAALAALAAGDQPSASYTVETLCDDLVVFMDALHIEKAHLIGYSMGGIVCQWAAIKYPRRVESLIPLMTTSGYPQLPPPSQEATDMAMGLAAPLADRHDAVQRLRHMWRVTTGSGFPATGEEEADFVSLMLEHGFRPEAISRQLLAVYAAPAHYPRLTEVLCPATVIHGSDDCFFHAEHGADLANRLPNARLAKIEGAGHNFTESLMPTLARTVLDHLSGCAPLQKAQANS